MAPLACDGASDPTPNVASGRRLDGGHSCWRAQDPGGPGQPPAGEPSAMAAAPPADLAAQGSMRAPKGLSMGPKIGRGQKTPRNAGAERQPVGRATAPFSVAE